MGEGERVWGRGHGKGEFFKAEFGERVMARRKEGQESEIRLRIWEKLNGMMEMEGMRRWVIRH